MERDFEWIRETSYDHIIKDIEVMKDRLLLPSYERVYHSLNHRVKRMEYKKETSTCWKVRKYCDYIINKNKPYLEVLEILIKYY